MNTFDSNLGKSDAHLKAGRYYDSLKLLQELANFRLTQQQKVIVYERLVIVHRTVGDAKSALPYCKKFAELTKQIEGSDSCSYAFALKELACTQMKSNSNKARQNVQKAIGIMKKLKLEDTEEYGSIIHALGRVYHAEGMDREARDNFTTARNILAGFKKSDEYSVVTTSLAISHSKKGEHDAAHVYFLEVYNIDLEWYGNKHPKYGSSALQLATSHMHIKQHSKAIPLLDEVLAIYRVTFGENHAYTQDVNKAIKKAREGDKPLIVGEATLLKQMKGWMEENGTYTEGSMDYLKTICKEVRMKDSKVDFDEVVKLVKGKQPEEIFRAAEDRNPKEKIAILMELLKKPVCDTLTKADRTKLYATLSSTHASLGEHKLALSYTQLNVQQTRELEGDKSANYAITLDMLATCHMNLGDLEEARKVAGRAMEIFPQDHKYRFMLLSTFGTIEQKGHNFEKAIEFYQQARQGGTVETNGPIYSGLTASIDSCYRKSGRWDLAYATRKEHISVVSEFYGEKSIEHAESLYCLACIYDELKQYELSYVTLQKVLSIQKQAGVPDKDKIAEIESGLAGVHERALVVHREDIDVGHMFRFCNQCERVAEGVEICNGCCRAWYCNTECQLKHWPTHKPHCTVCFTCTIPLDRDAIFLRCSTCKSTKYCSPECQKADWKEHKQTCKQ